MIAAAVILPLLIFLGLQFAFQAGDQRETVEAETLARAERVLVEVDGTLQRTLGALNVLATAQSVNASDWPALYARLHQLRRSEPGWITVRLVALDTNTPLFELRQPLGATVRPDGFPVPPRRPSGSGAFVGDMAGSGPGCPCALVHRFIDRPSGPPLLLTVAMDTRPFLRLLGGQTQRGRISAIVDRTGNFVARSLDHGRRVGTPATR